MVIVMGVLTSEDCDDSSAESTVLSTDGDCDGTITEEDCDDSNSESTVLSTDSDCDGVITEEDCDDSNSESTVLSTDGSVMVWLQQKIVMIAIPESTVEYRWRLRWCYYSREL